MEKILDQGHPAAEQRGMTISDRDGSPQAMENQIPGEIDYLIAMTDDVGMIQHARYNVPNRSTGYCVDDISRAFMVALLAAEHERYRSQAHRLANIYLAFLYDAQRPDGRFRNLMSYDRRWLEELGSSDANGRAIWALGFGICRAQNKDWRRICGEMLDRALPTIGDLGHERSLAYAGLGLSYAYLARKGHDSAYMAVMRSIALELAHRHRTSNVPEWDWFETCITYDNARLCEVLLRIGDALNDGEILDLGLRTLRFYESVVFENGIFVPIGHEGWYVCGGERSRNGQQPLEAAAVIDVELLAELLDKNIKLPERSHISLAKSAFAWFRGKNSFGVDMVSDGGCRDGLYEHRINENMGAESTLAYLWSAFSLAKFSASREKPVTGSLYGDSNVSRLTAIQ
jgi:hypothetical protein